MLISLPFTFLFFFVFVLLPVVFTPHAQHKWGKVIGVGVHIYMLYYTIEMTMLSCDAVSR